MHIWLVRHAIAAERDEFDGPDAERPLTDKGRKRFRKFCDRLADQTRLPASVISSPLLRAAETAEIFAKSAGLKKSDIVFTELLAPGAQARPLLRLLRDQPASSVALVGHEPDMSRCLTDLIGGGKFDFGKGHIAALEFDGVLSVGKGRLCWFLGPKIPDKK
ncbi:MAG TPA: histidine phosphatase family protein [Planctomycetaceae bacterium]|nr:histidine phosphatase family protein [Planctomycetaceae bacterium]